MQHDLVGGGLFKAHGLRPWPSYGVACGCCVTGRSSVRVSPGGADTGRAAADGGDGGGGRPVAGVYAQPVHVQGGGRRGAARGAGPPARPGGSPLPERRLRAALSLSCATQSSPCTACEGLPPLACETLKSAAPFEHASQHVCAVPAGGGRSASGGRPCPAYARALAPARCRARVQPVSTGAGPERGARAPQALITVSNHVAALDDPLVVSALLPPGALGRPAALRWTLCATDRCFRTRAAAAFFRAGKARALELAQHRVGIRVRDRRGCQGARACACAGTSWRAWGGCHAWREHHVRPMVHAQGSALMSCIRQGAWRGAA